MLLWAGLSNFFQLIKEIKNCNFLDKALPDRYEIVKLINLCCLLDCILCNKKDRSLFVSPASRENFDVASTDVTFYQQIHAKNLPTDW